MVSGLAPTNLPQTTSGSVTISGLDFGAFVLTATVSLEYEAAADPYQTCSSASWTSSTVVACAVIYALFQVICILDAQDRSRPMARTFVLAVVLTLPRTDGAMVKQSMCPLIYGYQMYCEVTLHGNRLWWPEATPWIQESSSQVQNSAACVTLCDGHTNCGAMYWVPGADCHFVAATCTVCNMGAGITCPNGLLTGYETIQAEYWMKDSYSPGTCAPPPTPTPTPSPTPVIAFTAVSSLNTPASGGSMLSFLGFGFGSTDVSPSAHAGGRPCATTSWTSSTQLLCVASAPTLTSGAPAPIIVGR